MAVAASDDSHLLGKFWLAESPDHQLTGWLDLSGSRPVVTVNGQLTPAMTSRAQNEDWDASEFADKEFDSVTHTIHGHLAEGRKRKVTIAEAVSASRRYNMILDVDPEGEPSGGVHVFRGAWAARGAHISVDETIGSASIRFANIDEWVRSNGVTVEIVPGDLGAKCESHTNSLRRIQHRFQVRVGGLRLSSFVIIPRCGLTVPALGKMRGWRSTTSSVHLWMSFCG